MKFLSSKLLYNLISICRYEIAKKICKNLFLCLEESLIDFTTFVIHNFIRVHIGQSKKYVFRNHCKDNNILIGVVLQNRIPSKD